MKFILLIAFLFNGSQHDGPYTWGDVTTHTPEVFASVDDCEAKFAEVAEKALATAKAAHDDDDVQMFYVCRGVTPGEPA